jgi:MOSC domain-containing protein YiiM
MLPTLVSIQVGRPRVLDHEDPWTSSIFKHPIDGPIDLGELNLAGDEQADLRVHGGPDKAVCVYSADHAGAWRREPGLEGWGPGAAGENFTVSGQTEVVVAIGDTFEVGDAVVQVSQPRGPCWKFGRKWNMPDLPRRVLRSGRTGWYLRVLSPGRVAPGQDLVLRERLHPEWTIARTNTVMYDRRTDRLIVRQLAECPSLAESWREALRTRV